MPGGKTIFFNQKMRKSNIILHFILFLASLLAFSQTLWGFGREVFAEPASINRAAYSLEKVHLDSFDLKIHAPSSGVAFYKDGIVFLSSTRKESKMVPSHVSFGVAEAYYGIPDDSLILGQQVFSPGTPFSFPVEAITFSNDYRTMYYTKNPQRGSREKIYRADQFSGGGNQGWVFSAIPLEFCTDNSRYSHPALSVDGTIMIFASDRTGTEGGMDLFVVEKDGDTWTEPRNLGKWVNTSGNELFPYLDKDNNLFFSSDGHAGLGGYDIFVCTFNGKGWDTPLQLSGDVNSSYDDVAFSISRKNERDGFLTRKQYTAGSEAQLFRVIMPGTPDDEGIALSSQLIEGARPLTALSVAAAETSQLVRTVLETAEVIEEKEPEEVKQSKKESHAKIESEVKKELEAKRESESIRELEAKLEEERKKVVQSQPLEKASVKDEINADTKPASMVKESTPVQEVKKPASSTPEATKKPATTTPAVTTKPASKPSVVTPPASSEKKDIVVYRVQISSSVKPKGSVTISIGGKNYQTYEYLYLGEYRTTVGELKTLEEAKALQSFCRKSGLTAFVVAFKDGKRSLDMDLFR